MNSFIGKKLRLKTRTKLIKVTITENIANMPSKVMFKGLDENGVDYLFTVYYGLHTHYAIGLFDDGFYGVENCRIKYSIKERFFKLFGSSSI